MITQQVARFLIKKVKELASNAPAPVESRTDKHLKDFLNNRSNSPQFAVLADDAKIVQAFRWRASWLAHKAYEAREVHKKPMNRLLISLHKLSKGP